MGIAKFLMFLPDWMYPHIYSDIPSDWYHVSFTRPLGWALCNRQVGRTKSGRPSPVLPEPEGRCKGNTATRGWTMYGLVMFRDLDNTLEILLDSKRGFQYFRIAWGTLKYLESQYSLRNWVHGTRHNDLKSTCGYQTKTENNYWSHSNLSVSKKHCSQTKSFLNWYFHLKLVNICRARSYGDVLPA